MRTSDDSSVMSSGRWEQPGFLVTGLTEGQEYTLQVIAVEDKYGVKSTEFNRSPTVTFATAEPEVESRHEGKGYKT